MQVSAFFREFGVSPDGPPPALTDGGMARAEEAYDRGLEDGLARARAEIAAEALVAIKALTARLEDISAEQDAMSQAVTTEAGMALASVVRGLCPGLAALGLADRARHLLETELCDAPRPLSLRAAPAIAESLGALDMEFTIESDDAMPATRIDIAWPEGGATIDADALSTRIMGLADALDPDSETVEDEPHD